MFQRLSKENSAQGVGGDIKHVSIKFPRVALVQHSYEKEHLEKKLKAGDIEKHVLHPTEKYPQGEFARPTRQPHPRRTKRGSVKSIQRQTSNVEEKSELHSIADDSSSLQHPRPARTRGENPCRHFMEERD